MLYVSGEESIRQIKIRADRLSVNKESILMISETNFENIDALIDEIEPKVVVIDSIQTVYSEALTSAPGSVSQVREVTGKLMQLQGSRNNCFYCGACYKRRSHHRAECLSTWLIQFCILKVRDIKIIEF